MAGKIFARKSRCCPGRIRVYAGGLGRCCDRKEASQMAMQILRLLHPGACVHIMVHRDVSKKLMALNIPPGLTMFYAQKRQERLNEQHNARLDRMIELLSGRLKNRRRA